MSSKKKVTKKTTQGKLLFRNGSDSYRVRNKKVYKYTANNKVVVCSMLRFTEQLHDVDDGGVFVKIAFRDGNGHRAEVLAPISEFMDRFPVRDTLVNRGFEIFDRETFKKFLPRYWDLKRPAKKTKITRSPGWHELDDGLYYVAPTWTAAPVRERDDALQLAPGSGSAITVLGIADEWNEKVASMCAGNPRLIFAVCAALTAPVLSIVNKPNIGIGFIGSSSEGKSTTLSVAASVFGLPTEYLDTWNATENALSSMALARLDAPFIGEEVGECSPKVMAIACYELINGRGRRRLGKDLELNRKVPYRGVVLFSGELSVTELMREGGIQAKEGQAVRLLSISPSGKFGMFDDLHGENDPALFADLLKEASGSCHGAIGRRWVRRLARDTEGMAATILNRAGRLSAQLREELPEGIPSNIASRVADSFALIAAVGETVIAKKLVPWEKGASLSAAKVCFKAWAKSYAVERTETIEDPLVKVRRFLQSESEGKFLPFSEYHEAKRKDLAGFMHVLSDGSPVFLMFPAYFEERFCSKGGKTVLIAALKKSDLLVCDTAGRPVKQIRIKKDPEGRKPGFYVIRRSIVDG